MEWLITIDQVGGLSRRWERAVVETFTGDVDDVAGQVSFEALALGWSCVGEPRRVHRLGANDVVAVTLGEGEFCVTATRLP